MSRLPIAKFSVVPNPLTLLCRQPGTPSRVPTALTKPTVNAAPAKRTKIKNSTGDILGNFDIVVASFLIDAI
jgi:hypothetical protein